VHAQRTLNTTEDKMASAAMASAAGATYAAKALPGRRAAARATASRASVRVRAAAEESTEGEKEDFDARAFRRELSKTDQYSRKFGKDEESAKAMEDAGIGMVSRGARAPPPQCTAGRGGWIGEKQKTRRNHIFLESHFFFHRSTRAAVLPYPSPSHSRPKPASRIAFPSPHKPKQNR
jgi:hypothetical protein